MNKKLKNNKMKQEILCCLFVISLSKIMMFGCYLIGEIFKRVYLIAKQLLFIEMLKKISDIMGYDY